MSLNESLQTEITATILTSVNNCLCTRYFNAMQLSVFKADSIYSALAQSVEHAAVNRSVVGSSPTSGAIPVIMATRIHLFPFRTQKLSSSTAKVLDHPRSGRIASCRISLKSARFQSKTGAFPMILTVFLKLRLYQKTWISAKFYCRFQSVKSWFLPLFNDNRASVSFTEF